MKKLWLILIISMLLWGCSSKENSTSPTDNDAVNNSIVPDARKFSETVSVNPDDPLDSVMSKRPDNVTTSWSRNGNKRICTWKFPDNSFLRFTFIPAEQQGAGLILYMVEDQ